MTTAVFDTLKASRNLKAAGVAESQAEAIVTTMADAFDDTVATKADMDKLEASVKADIAGVKADMDKLEASVKADIASVRADMDLMEARMVAAFGNAINRTLIAQLAVAGLLFAALKLF